MEVLFCELCGGTLNLLGVLGDKEHYNCQQCGAEFSVNLARRTFNPAIPEKEDDNILYYSDMEDDSLI